MISRGPYPASISGGVGGSMWKRIFEKLVREVMEQFLVQSEEDLKLASDVISTSYK